MLHARLFITFVALSLTASRKLADDAFSESDASSLQQYLVRSSLSLFGDISMTSTGGGGGAVVELSTRRIQPAASRPKLPQRSAAETNPDLDIQVWIFSLSLPWEHRGEY